MDTIGGVDAKMLNKFISNILGKDVGIGHDLMSCTKQILEYEVKHQEETIILVDTPGFDDSDVPDIVILKRLSDWLKKKLVFPYINRSPLTFHSGQ